MVDVWLLFCIVMNFIIIVIHAAVDSYIEESEPDSTGSSKPPDYYHHHKKVSPAWDPDNVAIVSHSRVNSAGKADYITWFSLKTLVLGSRAFVFVVFGIFNIGYWGYILS